MENDETRLECRCQHCPTLLTFTPDRTGETITCPSCGLDTELHTLAEPVPTDSAKLPAQGKKLSAWKAIHWSLRLVVVLSLGVVGAVVVALAITEPLDALKAGFGLLVSVLALAAFVCIYFLPAIIAGRRRKKNKTAIAILNLFAGWTFVGWVGALVWSLCED